MTLKDMQEELWLHAEAQFWSGFDCADNNIRALAVKVARVYYERAR